MKKRIFCTLLALAVPALSMAAACRPDKATNAIPDIKLIKLVEGLNEPVAITHANDSSGRLFVLEQEGVIRIIQDHNLQTMPFLDIRQRVVDGGEKGLLGIAFHPQFKHNGRFFVNYTAKKPGLTSLVAEYRVNTKGEADINTERVLLKVKQPWGNHNGGQLAFGADGYLYIAMGDGGAGDDPGNHGQNLSTLLGAILRIDVDSTQPHRPYGIPADNPFRHRHDAQPEIWAYGLRNPWRFSFDRQTGELYAADVGQNDIEEINIIKKGKNYGWRIMEGPICTPGVDPRCNKTGLTLPIYSYTHDTGRSITGGYVYRGEQFPELCGTYLYGDFTSQAIWGLRYQNHEVVAHKTLFAAKSLLGRVTDYLADEGLMISTFGEDEAGEIYVADYQSGRIYRIAKK